MSIRRSLRVPISICISGLICVIIYYYSSYYNTYPRTRSYPNPDLPILIPRTIHQLYISPPSEPQNISSIRSTRHTRSWQHQHDWKNEYWHGESCFQLARGLDLDSTSNLHASSESETSRRGRYAETYRNLPTAILRSDFCRYVILLARGGVYSDLDVRLWKPLPWNVMGERKREVEADWEGMGEGDDAEEGPPRLIVGMEGDRQTIGLPRSPQFVQWTMASVPGHGVLKGVVEMIVERTPRFGMLGIRNATQQDENIDIMNWTGPGVWTDAVLEYLNCTYEQIELLKDLKHAMRIKDVVVLPKRALAVTQGEDHTDPDILVKHYFEGSWKSCKDSWFERVISFSFGC